MRVLDAALAYATRGIPVYPLAPGARVPLKDSHGFHEATTDRDRIMEWWREHPGANVGAPTGPASGFWVLDVDVQHDGPATLAALEAEHGPLPETAEASTPSGGRHIYFAWSGCPPELRNSTARIGRGLDVRADGGSIVLPPTTLRDGRGYRWRHPRASLAVAPSWLIQLAVPPPRAPRADPKPLQGKVEHYVAAAVARELHDLALASAGTRNDRLFRAGCALFGFVLAGTLPETWTRQHLAARAAAIGLEEREIERTLASAWAKAAPREIPA